MSKQNVAVIFGGASNEYEVSLKSSYAVVEALGDDYNVIKIGITKNGEWYEYRGENKKILNNTWSKDLSYLNKLNICLESKCFYSNEKINIDVAFIALHGRNGEDGRVQGLLDLLDIPYTGCDVLSSALCMDKFKSHLLVEKYGVKTANKLYFKETDNIDYQSIRSLNLPLYIKPINSGSSIGITRIESYDLLEQAINDAFLVDSQLVVEEEVKGYEVGCAIVGNEDIFIGNVDKVELQTKFFSFEEKYQQEHSKIRSLNEDAILVEQIKKEALTIYQALGCSGFARIDMFVSSNNEIYFNEVNTIPGFTNESRYPKMMKEAGISFKNLVTLIIRAALSKKDLKLT
ncbi:MAG: D-alanine--D-alanine ligase family protein [Erysipelotrichales bacterium]